MLRRRLTVSAVVLVVLVASLVAVRALAGLLGSGPPTTPEQVPAAGAPVHVAHVVQPGETVWQIARALRPEGDVRPLVDRLMSARHHRPLQVGEAVFLPGGR